MNFPLQIELSILEFDTLRMALLTYIDECKSDIDRGLHSACYELERVESFYSRIFGAESLQDYYAGVNTLKIGGEAVES